MQRRSAARASSAPWTTSPDRYGCQVFDDDPIDQSCDRHGTGRHMHIHEAGHAVAALDNGIPFRAVIVYADGDGPKLDGELMEAWAQVDTGPDATVWVQPDRIRAFRFICAGAASETAIFGHAIEGGFEHDLKVWRVGAGATQPMDEEQFIEAVGADPRGINEETDQWAQDNAERILKLADHLGTLTPTAEVSYVEVAALLA